jgi:O-antigen/teichoic acid export membrane protein
MLTNLRSGVWQIFLVMAGGPIHSVFYWVGKGSEERKKFINATWVLTLLLSSTVLLIGFPIENEIAGQIDLPYKYVFILLLTVFFTCPSGHFTETSIALGKSDLGSVFDTLSEVTKAARFIFTSWKFRNLENLFLFFAYILSLKLVVSIFLNHKYNEVGLQADKQAIKQVFIYCLPISLSSCLSFFVEKSDLLLLSVQKVMIPSLSKNYISKDWNAAGEIFRKAISDIRRLFIPSIFGLIIFATPIVKILYTKQYLKSAIYLQLFSFSYLILMLPHDSVARATGNMNWVLKVYLLVTPIASLGAAMAAKYVGVKGVLIVTILVKFIPKFLDLRLSKELMNWQWKEMFPVKKLGIYLGICSLLSLTCIVLKGFFLSDVQWFLVCGTSFAIIYLGIVYTLFQQGCYA